MRTEGHLWRGQFHWYILGIPRSFFWQLYSIMPVCFDAVCLTKHRQQRQRRHINTYVNGEWQSVQGLRSLQSVVNPAQDRKKREVLCFGFCFPTVVAIPTGSARLAQLETALWGFFLSCFAEVEQKVEFVSLHEEFIKNFPLFSQIVGFQVWRPTAMFSTHPTGIFFEYQTV